MSEKQQRIQLDQIDKPRIMLRPVRRNSPEYIELVESISKDGVLQPILVRPREGRYEIVEGWHRYEASKEAGCTSIPCLVREMTDDEVLVFQIKCNAIRPKTATFEYARRLKILMERGLTLTELSAMIDKSPQWIRDQIHLNRLCAEAREPVERGEITMGSALALANLPEDLQTKFIDDAIALKQHEFVDRAKTALRDFKAFLLQLQREDKENGAATPKLRSINVLKREAVKPRQAKEVLKAAGAKTALDGWNACLAWIFRLDPISVEKRKAGNKERENVESMATQEEYLRLNREMIQKFVNPQSRNGDYRT